jgi:hypothetical protein
MLRYTQSKTTGLASLRPHAIPDRSRALTALWVCSKPHFPTLLFVLTSLLWELLLLWRFLPFRNIFHHSGITEVLEEQVTVSDTVTSREAIWVCWGMPVVPAPGSQRQQDWVQGQPRLHRKSEASLDSIVRPCLNKTKQQQKKTHQNQNQSNHLMHSRNKLPLDPIFFSY